MTSIELHLEHEKNLELVNFKDVILESEAHQKIKITYQKAIEIISKSILTEEFKDFEISLNDKINSPNRIVGAGVNKLEGLIWVFTIASKKTHEWVGQRIQWTESTGWYKVDCTYFQKEANESFPFAHFLSDNLIKHAIYSKNNIHIRGPIYCDIFDSQNTHLTVTDRFLPIEDLESNSTHEINTIGFTINYQDILNHISIHRLKNARSGLISN